LRFAHISSRGLVLHTVTVPLAGSFCALQFLPCLRARLAFCVTVTVCFYAHVPALVLSLVLLIFTFTHIFTLVALPSHCVYVRSLRVRTPVRSVAWFVHTTRSGLRLAHTHNVDAFGYATRFLFSCFRAVLPHFPGRCHTYISWTRCISTGYNAFTQLSVVATYTFTPLLVPRSLILCRWRAHLVWFHLAVLTRFAWLPGCLFYTRCTRSFVCVVSSFFGSRFSISFAVSHCAFSHTALFTSVPVGSLLTPSALTPFSVRAHLSQFTHRFWFWLHTFTSLAFWSVFAFWFVFTWVRTGLRFSLCYGFGHTSPGLRLLVVYARLYVSFTTFLSLVGFFASGLPGWLLYVFDFVWFIRWTLRAVQFASSLLFGCFPLRA